MKVRAKFYVSSITLSSYDQGSRQVKLQAVTRKEGDNAEFFKSTPSGSIDMNISNPETAQWFQDRLGRDFYVDFTEADEEVRKTAYAG